MTVSRRTTVVSAAALTALLALAACNGADPVVGPTRSSSSTSSKTTTAPPTTTTTSKAATTTSRPSVDPVLAKIPKAARPETMQGAEAFSSYYVSQLNRAYRTANPEELAGLAAPSCKTCKAFVGAADELSSDGYRHDSDALTVTQSSTIKFVDGERIVGVYVTQNAVKVVDSQGAVVRRTKPGRGAFVFRLSYDTRWIVSSIQTVAQ